MAAFPHDARHKSGPPLEPFCRPLYRPCRLPPRRGSAGKCKTPPHRLMSTCRPARLRNPGLPHAKRKTRLVPHRRKPRRRGRPSAGAPSAVMWLAAVVSNIGSWMYNAASAWLMTSLDPHPLTVSLVQAANTLPIVPVRGTGGSARRHLRTSGAFSSCSRSRRRCSAPSMRRSSGSASRRRPNLLIFTFLIAAFGALVGAGLAIGRAAARRTGGNVRRRRRQQRRHQCQPRHRPRRSAARSSSRSASSAPFWINAASNLAIVGALLWWHPPRRLAAQLPAERFGSALRNRLALRQAQSPSARDAGARRRLLPVRQRLLGAAAAGRARADRRRGPSSTACSWARSAPAPSAAPSRCPG